MNRTVILSIHPSRFQTQTMASLEMAGLAEKRHDSVKRTIDTLAAHGTISQPQIVDGMKSANGVVEQVYLIGKRDSYVVMAQLSPEFTARLVDRWQELEEKAAKPAFALPDFTNPAAAARAWADAVELSQTLAIKSAQQQTQLTIAAPKAKFVDQYVESTGLKGFREVAKLLQLKENWFRKFLADRKIMYRLGSEWMPYAPHLEAGRFEVKTGTSLTSGHAFNEAKFTAKGIEWIAGLVASERVSSALKECK